jgi:hypothetical protein
MVGFGALLFALGVFFFLDGRSENRFGRSVGRSAEGEEIGGKLIATAGKAMIALGAFIMIGLIALVV